MKYLNKFSDKASYEAWKRGESFIKPSLNLTNGGEMMYDYDPHFRAKYLFGDSNDISTNLTQCGNIFESLKINGVEYSDGNVQVEGNSRKYGSQGEIVYHEMTYNSNVCGASEFNWRSYAIPFNSTFTFQIIEPIDDISNILVGAFSFMNKPQLIPQTDLLVIDSGQQIFSFGYGDMAYLISSLELCGAYVCVVVQNQSSGEYYTVKIQSQTISGELKNGTPYSCTNGDFQLSGTTLISPTDKYVSGDNCCVTVRTSAETSAYGVLIHLMDADKTTITFSTDELYQTFGIQFDNVSKSIVIPNDVVFYAQTTESAPVKGGRMVFALIDMSNSANTISSTTEVILPSEVTYTYEEFDILENNTVSNANEWNGVVFSTDIPLRKNGAWVVCNGYVDGDESNLPYFYICNDEDLIIEDNTYQFSEIGINNINTYFENLNCTSIDCFPSYDMVVLSWISRNGMNQNMILTFKSYYALPYYISDIQITGGAPQIIKATDIVSTDDELPYELNVIGRISDKVNFIPKEGFKDTCLDSVIIQEGIETIQAKAFYNCPKMRHAWLPSTMKSIGNEGFMGTIKEQSCFGLDNVKTIGRDVFGDIVEQLPFEFVDLGLPSGLKWATYNVGATKPEESGLYFAWGETQGYTELTDEKQFSGVDYKWSADADGTTMTKYNETDGLTTLESADDAATAVYSGCRMPTSGECQELTANTTSAWTTVNGVSGVSLTSKSNGNSIFIPVSGLYADGYGANVGEVAYLWSSSLSSSDVENTYIIYFSSDGVNVEYFFRFIGIPVRAVKE